MTLQNNSITTIREKKYNLITISVVCLTVAAYASIYIFGQGEFNDDNKVEEGNSHPIKAESISHTSITERTSDIERVDSQLSNNIKKVQVIESNRETLIKGLLEKQSRLGNSIPISELYLASGDTVRYIDPNERAKKIGRPLSLVKASSAIDKNNIAPLSNLNNADESGYKEYSFGEDEPPKIMGETIFGELMDLSEIKEQEALNKVPSKKELNVPFFGSPVPSRNERIGTYRYMKDSVAINDILREKELRASKRAAIEATPKFKQRVRRIKYSSSKINKITVADTLIANIIFRDRYGKPVPVSRAKPKETHYFKSSITGSSESPLEQNIVEIQGTAISGSGNLSVLVGGKSEPVIFEIIASQTVNDSNVTVMLDHAGPNSSHVVEQPKDEGYSLCKDPYIDPLVAGIVSGDLRKLEIPNPNIQIYTDGHSNYIRSTLVISTPDCECQEFGADDLNVCKIPGSIGNVIYMGDAGQMAQLNFNSQL